MKTKKHLLYYTSHNVSSAHAKMPATKTKYNQPGNKKNEKKKLYRKRYNNRISINIIPTGDTIRDIPNIIL